MSALRRVLVGGNSFRQALYSSVRQSSLHDQNPNVVHPSIPEIEIPQVTVPEFVSGNFQNWGHKVATECAVTGKQYTYGDVLKKTRNLGGNLRKKLKLQKGDVVAVHLPNVPEFFIAALGSLNVGLIVTTLNPLYTAEEIQRQLIDSGTKAIITLVDLFPNVDNAVKLCRKQIPTLTIKMKSSQATPPGAINFHEFTDNDCSIEDLTQAKHDDVAFLPYSSGTTGLPKGVKLTHRNIVANMIQFASPGFKITFPTTEQHQDIAPFVLPLFHIYGLTSSLAMLKEIAKVVTLPKFTPDLYLSTLIKQKPHLLYVVPPIVLFLTNHQAVKREYFDTIRSAISGAAPLGALDEEKFLEKVQKPIDILQGYGLTETSPVVTMVSIAKKMKNPNIKGSIGEAVPATSCKIIDLDDPTGTPLGSNQKGELLVKGPQVMQCYHNRPEQTKETFLDGWLRTGDMAYYDKDKHFYITDRLKELIKVKAFQVPPAELEEIIRDFPAVADAAVIGIPHEKDGEVPRAYVVAKKDSNLDVNKLQEFVSSKVAQYKQLRGGIAVVDAIPKNLSGKILRRELKLQYAAENK